MNSPIPTLKVSNPHALVRAMAVCGALGVVAPTQPQLNWVASQTPLYENWGFWLPYQKLVGDRYSFVHPAFWLLGAYKLMAPDTFRDVATHDPEVWFHDILPRTQRMLEEVVIHPSMHPVILEVADQAQWLGSATGAAAAGDSKHEATLADIFMSVRIAQQSKSIEINSRIIRSRASKCNQIW